MSFDLDTTPTDEEVIQMAIEQRLFNLNVALPGQVVDYDPKTQTATIQPMLQRSYQGTLINLPPIQKVPVSFMSGGGANGWAISGPLVAGDTGQLIFNQRSIDIWKTKGGIVNPADPRKFHLSDATFYPGMVPASGAINNSTSNLVFKNGITEFALTPDGKMHLKGVSSNEIVDLLSQLAAQVSTIAQKLNTDTTNTQIGPQALNNAAAYGTAKSAVDTIKGKVDSIKG